MGNRRVGGVIIGVFIGLNGCFRVLEILLALYGPVGYNAVVGISHGSGGFKTHVLEGLRNIWQSGRFWPRKLRVNRITAFVVCS